ncbi:MAG: hypothetical protein IIV92_05400 [Schwartzia sp.]|nr:hypothetical protein [Schwartzia sp. (in: firmicutes)]
MITLILQGIAVLFLLMIIGYKLLCIVEGDADLVLEKDTEKKFAKASRDEDSVTIRRRLTFRNRGKQAAVVSDCIARTQLPYEQYDGIEARGRVERVGEPREDDYFEAVIVDPHKSIDIDVFITLKARKGQSLEFALSRMVDMPIDIIYTTFSRRPYKLLKDRIVMTAQEAADSVGVKLVDED